MMRNPRQMIPLDDYIKSLGGIGGNIGGKAACKKKSSNIYRNG